MPGPLRNLDEVLLPAGPLQAFLQRKGGLQAALRDELPELAAARYRRQVAAAVESGTISAAAADQLAGHGFGLHPSRIWGRDWWTADDLVQPSR